MADITVTQNVLVPMVREVYISRFPAGNKNNFSAFIFNIGNAPCNTRVKQDTTKHQQEHPFFLHRIHFPLTWMELEQWMSHCNTHRFSAMIFVLVIESINYSLSLKFPDRDTDIESDLFF